MSKTVPLTQPISLFENQPSIREVVLKEPKGSDFLSYGEVLIWARTSDGAVFTVEDKAAIRGYLGRCIDHPNGTHVIDMMCLADARAVKEALLSFFDGGAATSGT